MFTGLIEETGRVDRVASRDAGVTLSVETTLGSALASGESIAVNGVCLTVVNPRPDGFTADVSPQTLAVTSLGRMTVGQVVNLERPLAVGARLGGHFVLGHVDAVGAILALSRTGDSWWLDVTTPRDIEPYLIPKGSIAIDGISLTIAALAPGRVGVQIIPYTFAHTALSTAAVGDVVNLEADVLGKYVARLLDARANSVDETRAS